MAFLFRWARPTSTTGRFALNDKADLNIYDEAFATAQTVQFKKDLAQFRRMTSRHDRPFHEKLLEHAAALISNQL
ncbi:hypothetical protein QTI33_09045 [Variovorax sp. J22P271]|uniref:hypothetical protein n=1 Tax=Variovorax davisae TaxID=3053515 RepID=UPI002575FA77|nr:hypothetical protein [Variovorax sp. J22P271]MDM0032273.1 hypothetical protein [Variovorax sp. J22P271]